MSIIHPRNSTPLVVHHVEWFNLTSKDMKNKGGVKCDTNCESPCSNTNTAFEELTQHYSGSWSRAAEEKIPDCEKSKFRLCLSFTHVICGMRDDSSGICTRNAGMFNSLTTESAEQSPPPPPPPPSWRRWENQLRREGGRGTMAA